MPVSSEQGPFFCIGSLRPSILLKCAVQLIMCPTESPSVILPMCGLATEVSRQPINPHCTSTIFDPHWTLAKFLDVPVELYHLLFDGFSSHHLAA
jgi:hypothetical protein